MLLRICLIIAILAGLAAGALSYTKVQEIIVTTRASRDDWNHKYVAENKTRVKAESTLKKTAADLETTKKDLARTKTSLDNSVAKAEELDKRNSDLSSELDKTRGDRDTAQAKLEQWNLIGLEPGQVKGVIADLEKTKKDRDAVIAENKIIIAARNELQSRWDKFFGSEGPVILPAGLHGKILAVDPKYDFVVLDIGDEQGAKERGEMMINRGGRLIGKVKISSVQKDRCVANILPDWKNGDAMEGDEVLY
jgi:DNA repair exonuclease SbcCD ATPase subunit